MAVIAQKSVFSGKNVCVGETSCRFILQSKEGVAIHQSAVIGHNVTIKAPTIISENCFVGSNSYLRGGVFMAPEARNHCAPT